MSSLEDLQAEFSRLRSLLSPKRARRQLALAPPPWNAEGALASAGLTAEGVDAEIGVYVFSSGDAAQEAARDLKAKLERQGGHTVAGTNGVLLFVGRLVAGGPDDESALNRIASAFAGDE
jgi:hypothetical protein